MLGALALCICRDDRGVLGAEMDVPRSVTKRVTYLYYTLFSYLSFVSSLPSGVKERGVGETGGKEKGVWETGGKTTGVKERGVGETRAKE